MHADKLKDGLEIPVSDPSLKQNGGHQKLFTNPKPRLLSNVCTCALDQNEMADERPLKCNLFKKTTLKINYLCVMVRGKLRQRFPSSRLYKIL